jgi:hypothetical protein
VVELVPVTASVVTCVADPSAIDRLRAVKPAIAVRVAPDEALLIGLDAARLLDEASDAIAAADADAIVLDTTDGWTGLALEGEGALEVFARVSQVPPPDGAMQGEVAHVPTTVVAEPGGILLLIPAMWRDAVRERILADGASLGIVERDEPRPWNAASGGRP